MNISSQKKIASTSRAFNLTELLVVLAMTALLAIVLLSAAFTTQERALRAECVSNLRQIGVGLNIYSTEANGYLPLYGWKSGGFPWQTYEACRYSGAGKDVATGGIIEGPYALGSLFFTKAVASGKTFYCPAIPSGIFSYATYNDTAWPWPAIPPDFGVGNAYVRCGYNYYPQSRVTETVSSAGYGNYTAAALTFQLATFTSPNPNDPPNTINVPVVLKMSAVNPKKSITTDLVNTTSTLSHRASGSAVGLNALFPDGHVTFQTVRNHNKKASKQPFDPNLWDPINPGPIPGTGPVDDPDGFRIIMNGWSP